MNRKACFNLIFASALIALALGNPTQKAYALTGGPEESGYIFIDSDESGAPAYSYEDISSTATLVGLGDNQISPAVDLGFTFTFFGIDYSQVYIGSNGFITFLPNQDAGASAQEIPTAASPNAIIAGWWGNLMPHLAGSIRYQTLGAAPNRYFIVQYQDVPFAILSIYRVSFEIKLFETTQAIEIHYSSAPAYSDIEGTTGNYTVGIENETGLRGLQYHYGVDGLPASFVVQFTPFVGVAMEPDSGIGYAQAGETKTFTMSVYNWTGVSDTFDLSVSPLHNNWVTRLPENTGVIDQGGGYTFNVEVDFPTDAAIADYYEFDVGVTSQKPKEDATFWTDTTRLITAVPRVGYVFNQNQINPVDTQFHQDLGGSIDTTPYGNFMMNGALSPDGEWLYGLLAGAQDDEGGVMLGKLLIFDTDNLSAAPVEVVVGYDESSVATTADGKFALITSFGDGLLLVVDTDPDSATYRTLINSIATGSQPVRVTTSSCLNKAYVTNKQGNSVTMVDLTTLRNSTPTTKTITGLNAPWGVVVAPSGDRAYVANNGNGTIGVIDTLTDVLLTTWNVGGSSLQDIDVSPDGDKLYAAGSANVLAVNTATGAVSATIPNESSGVYSVEVFPAAIGNLAYISNGGVQTISVIDTATDTVTYTMAMPGAPSSTALFPMETACPYAPIAAYEPANAVGQLGVPFIFTDKSIRHPTSFTWDFGDGSEPGTGPTPEHTYTTPGTYALIMTATNPYGSSSASGTINFKPKAGFTPSLGTINPDEAVNFSNTTTGNPAITYSWDFGDGTTSTEVNPSHTYAQVGMYTVTLQASNSWGTDTATGTVVYLPTSSFSPASSVIQTGDAITFTNASTGTAPLTFTWDFGDGSPTSGETNPSHTYTTAGSFMVKLKVENTWGSSESTGTVNFRPKAGFSPALSIIQPGDSVSFVNSSTGTAPLTYTWDFGDGSPAVGDVNPNHVYNSIGEYTVSLKVENDYGTETVTGKVVFPPVASFAQSSSIIRTGDTVTFTNGSTGTAPLTYLWEFGDGATSTDTNPSHQYTTAGAYTVRLTASNTYASSTATGTVNFAPKAAFTPVDQVIQLGQPAVFTNQTTGTSPLSYSWNFGDGATSTAASPSHTYSAAGVYSVSLTVTNGFGSETVSGTVAFAPKAGFSPADSIVQLGDSITFTNQSSGASPLTYTWDFGDGTASSSDPSPTHTYASAGSYTVTLKVENAYGADTFTGTVRFSPKAGFSPASEVIQVGESIAYTNTTTGTGPITYRWTFGDGSPESSAVSPIHQFTTGGNYTVTLVATNAYGTDMATGTVDFPPAAGFIPINNVIHLGDTLEFTNQTMGSAPISYAWDFGDGSPISTETHPSHQYTTVGSYTVKLTATNAFGSDEATTTVSFSPKAAFSPLDTVIRLGDTITFSNESTGSGPLTYTWDFGDGVTSNEANPVHTYLTAGSYTVTLQVSNSVATDTATGTVHFAPRAGFTPRDNVIRLGRPVVFSNTSTGTLPLSFTWDFGDDSPVVDNASPAHVYATAGSYIVKLKVTNAYGSETVSGTVNFSPTADFSIDPPGTISSGTTVTFTNLSTGTAPLSFTWDFGDNSPSISNRNANHIFTSRGAFRVKLTAHSDRYGDDSIEKEVVVEPYRVNLTVTLDDGVEYITPGSAAAYSLLIQNDGPEDLLSAHLIDAFSDWLVDPTWTCTATTGSTCSPFGSGNILEDYVSIQAGGRVTYTIHAGVAIHATGVLTNTATVVLTSAYENANPTGASATHETILISKVFLPLAIR